VGKLRESMERLQRLGFNTPYEAWLCVEHGECPEGVDYGEVFNALMDYLEALSERGESPGEEWERRYMEERREKRKAVVPA
jgi:hypothetical protein